MIVGVGIDLVEVARVRRLLERYGERFLKRIYLPEEISYALSRKDPAPSLAARFAAKEAFIKAFPARASLVEVGVGFSGEKPVLVLKGKTAERARALGLSPLLSLSHERGLAAAVVILTRSLDLKSSAPSP